MTLQGVPLKPSHDALQRRAVRSLARAVVAAALRRLDRRAALPWDHDDDAELILRAASPPLTTGGASAITPIVPHFLASLIPLSAGAAVLGLGVGLNFN